MLSHAIVLASSMFDVSSRAKLSVSALAERKIASARPRKYGLLLRAEEEMLLYGQALTRLNCNEQFKPFVYLNGRTTAGNSLNLAWGIQPVQEHHQPARHNVAVLDRPDGAGIDKGRNVERVLGLAHGFFLEFFAAVSRGERFNQGPPDRFPRPRRDLRRSRRRRDQPSSGNRVAHGGSSGGCRRHRPPTQTNRPDPSARRDGPGPRFRSNQDRAPTRPG